MTPEKAIQTAIDYEEKIRDLYRESAAALSDPVGKKVLEALAEEEQHHVDYLNDRLHRWRQDGTLDVTTLETVVPEREKIQQEVTRLRNQVPEQSLGDEKRILSAALALEMETSDFYRRMVGEMSGDAQQMFSRFLEIEDGHITIVQAELDFISSTGFWFDFQEFDMEH